MTWSNEYVITMNDDDDDDDVYKHAMKLIRDVESGNRSMRVASSEAGDDAQRKPTSSMRDDDILGNRPNGWKSPVPRVVCATTNTSIILFSARSTPPQLHNLLLKQTYTNTQTNRQTHCKLHLGIEYHLTLAYTFSTLPFDQIHHVSRRRNYPRCRRSRRIGSRSPRKLVPVVSISI
jgi:hypothetical protein